MITWWEAYTCSESTCQQRICAVQTVIAYNTAAIKNISLKKEEISVLLFMVWDIQGELVGVLIGGRLNFIGWIAHASSTSLNLLCIPTALLMKHHPLSLSEFSQVFLPITHPQWRELCASLTDVYLFLPLFSFFLKGTVHWHGGGGGEGGGGYGTFSGSGISVFIFFNPWHHRDRRNLNKNFLYSFFLIL